VVRPNFWIDKRVERERAASTQLTQRDRVEGGTVTEQVDATHIAVRLDGSELPDVVAPSESGVSAVGAWVRAIRDSTGRIVKFGIPDSIPSGAVSFSVGVTGERLVQLDATTAALDAGLESARAQQAADKAELDGKLAENSEKLTELDETTVPGLVERVGTVETNLATAQGQLSDARGDLTELNDTTLPAMNAAMKDAATLTEGTLDNARLNVGTLAAQIANVIELNVSRLVADDASVNTAVVNKLAVAIANVIELNADRITAGTIDTSRLDAQSVAAAIGQFLQLDVGQLTAGSADIGDVVAQKIWAGVAKFAEITTEMLLAGNAVITGDMMVDTLIGKILSGAVLTAGGGGLPQILVGPASGTPGTGDTYGVYLTTPNNNAHGSAHLAVTPAGPEFSMLNSDQSTLLSMDGTNGLKVQDTATNTLVALTDLMFKQSEYYFYSENGKVQTASSGSSSSWSAVGSAGGNGNDVLFASGRALLDVSMYSANSSDKGYTQLAVYLQDANGNEVADTRLSLKDVNVWGPNLNPEHWSSCKRLITFTPGTYHVRVVSRAVGGPGSLGAINSIIYEVSAICTPR
jgi:hypothetical protein